MRNGLFHPITAGVVVFLLLFIPNLLLLTTYTAPTEPTEPAPTCNLDYLVNERQRLIFDRDQGLYQEQARLNAMQELNAEMQVLVKNEINP